MPEANGVVTNPPYRLSVKFVEKALKETGYVALLLRMNFLESTARVAFFRNHPPENLDLVAAIANDASVRVAGLVLSNTCYAWFVWDEKSEQKRIIDWFDWKEITEKLGGSGLIGPKSGSLRAVA